MSADLEADLGAGDGSAAVVIRYVLATGMITPGGDRLPLFIELLGFGDATTDRVEVDGVGEVVLWPTVGSHRSAAVSIVEGVGADRTELTLRYRVERAVTRSGGSLRAVVPVVAGPGAPASGEGGGFTARIVVPADWTPSEGFPSGLRRGADGAYVASLPVVPAMVGFRGRSDGVWRPGLPILIDVLTLTILLAFSIVGWGHLRRVAREGVA